MFDYWTLSRCYIYSLLYTQTLRNFSVEYGDIVFQRSSETPEDIGRSNVYLDEKIAAFGGFVIRGKRKGNYDPLFLKYLLDSRTARKEIVRMGQGAQHYNIGQEGLRSIALFFPTEEEQHRIALCIGLIDRKIELAGVLSRIILSHEQVCLILLMG